MQYVEMDIKKKLDLALVLHSLFKMKQTIIHKIGLI